MDVLKSDDFPDELRFVEQPLTPEREAMFNRLNAISKSHDVVLITPTAGKPWPEPVDEVVWVETVTEHPVEITLQQGKKRELDPGEPLSVSEFAGGFKSDKPGICLSALTEVIKALGISPWLLSSGSILDESHYVRHWREQIAIGGRRIGKSQAVAERLMYTTWLAGLTPRQRWAHQTKRKWTQAALELGKFRKQR